MGIESNSSIQKYSEVSDYHTTHLRILCQIHSSIREPLPVRFSLTATTKARVHEIIRLESLSRVTSKKYKNLQNDPELMAFMSSENLTGSGSRIEE
jgi:hypothetical protein